MKFKLIIIFSVLSSVAAFSPAANIAKQSVSLLGTPSLTATTNGWNVARSMVASPQVDTAVNGSMSTNGQRKKTKEVRRKRKCPLMQSILNSLLTSLSLSSFVPS